MPKWPNPSYTNIMIATHADSLVAEAVNKGFTGFSPHLAWDAVYKDAMTPPDGDTTRSWRDREPHTPYEARAGLTYLKTLGYIPADKTAEAASSTLEDAYDDWCVAQVAKSLGRTADYNSFVQRSLNYKHLFNPQTGFMQARNSDGSWASQPQVGMKVAPGSTPGTFCTIYPAFFSSWAARRNTTPASTQTYADWGIDYLKYDQCSFGDIIKKEAGNDLDKAAAMQRAAYEKMHRTTPWCTASASMVCTGSGGRRRKREEICGGQQTTSVTTGTA
jgi:hypothetical protein